MNALLSLMMLAAGALVAGAYYLWRRGASRLQVVLMLVMALVIVGNVAIWTVPAGDSPPPVKQQLR
jgi:hypothetical protein